MTTPLATAPITHKGEFGLTPRMLEHLLERPDQIPSLVRKIVAEGDLGSFQTLLDSKSSTLTADNVAFLPLAWMVFQDDRYQQAARDWAKRKEVEPMSAWQHACKAAPNDSIERGVAMGALEWGKPSVQKSPDFAARSGHRLLAFLIDANEKLINAPLKAAEANVLVFRKMLEALPGDEPLDDVQLSTTTRRATVSTSFVEKCLRTPTGHRTLWCDALSDRYPRAALQASAMAAFEAQGSPMFWHEGWATDAAARGWLTPEAIHKLTANQKWVEHGASASSALSPMDWLAWTYTQELEPAQRVFQALTDSGWDWSRAQRASWASAPKDAFKSSLFTAAHHAIKEASLEFLRALSQVVDRLDSEVLPAKNARAKPMPMNEFVDHALSIYQNSASEDMKNTDRYVRAVLAAHDRKALVNGLLNDLLPNPGPIQKTPSVS